MARSRNIKPGILDNEELAALPPFARLLFIYLWMLADKAGRLEDRPGRIKKQALGYDSVDANDLLQQLSDSGFIERYEVDGNRLIQIVNFEKHQSPHVREQASQLPGLEYRTDKVVTKHNQGSAIASPRSPDSLIPDSLIPDSNIISPQAAQPATPEKKRKGTRLPDDWRPTQDYVTAAQELNPDYTKDWFRETAHKFRDYWIAKSGRDATKTNWLATWRNWVRNDLEFRRGKPNANTKQLDNDSTEWIDRVFGETASGDTGEQDFSFIEGDFSCVVGGDQGSGLLEPGEGGMAQGAG